MMQDNGLLLNEDIPITSHTIDSGGSLRLGICEDEGLLNQFRREQAAQTVNLIRRGDLVMPGLWESCIKKGSC